MKKGQLAVVKEMWTTGLITVLTGFALYLGYDGAVLNAAMVALGASGGVAVGRAMERRANGETPA
jgi:hypothetical protein